MLVEQKVTGRAYPWLNNVCLPRCCGGAQEAFWYLFDVKCHYSVFICLGVTPWYPGTLSWFVTVSESLRLCVALIIVSGCSNFATLIICERSYWVLFTTGLIGIFWNEWERGKWGFLLISGCYVSLGNVEPLKEILIHAYLHLSRRQVPSRPRSAFTLSLPHGCVSRSPISLRVIRLFTSLYMGQKKSWNLGVERTCCCPTKE